MHAAKGCNAMYEVYILAIYHVANAERNCFRGKTMLRTSCIHCKYHFQKKISAIPVEFLYITVHVRL